MKTTRKPNSLNREKYKDCQSWKESFLDFIKIYLRPYSTVASPISLKGLAM